MQLAGPGVFGPPADPDAAIRVLRAAVEAGSIILIPPIFYGPHITNQLIRKALHPYADDLCIVTKSALVVMKGQLAAGDVAGRAHQAVEDNLRNLGLDVLEIVNLRSMLGTHGPVEGSLEAPLTTLLNLKNVGLFATSASVTSRRSRWPMRKLTPVVCVQNQYNVANRGDDALIDELAAQNIAYVPFFPLGDLPATGTGN